MDSPGSRTRNRGGIRKRCFALGLMLLGLGAPAALKAENPRPQVEIPKVDRELLLDDFVGMEPSEFWSGRLAKVEGFRQTQPSDGQPVTQKTVVYLAYDEKHLYVVFVAFDEQPVRATLARRDGIDNSEDWVEVAIDTFNDQRRAYLFDSTALGVQWDALHSESSGENPQFDEVWHSRGKITNQGFVTLLKIPFKSLRFPPGPSQSWGIQFRRWIARIPELATWPLDSTTVEGRLAETATLTGLREVSPGRNMQFIPYGTFRAFRALDERDPLHARFVGERAEVDGGLDAKAVFKDALTLDVTLNPDFNQVESDSPQITVNQRFEVFFPEKRPFFLENADFFRTLTNLVFTRRIADPQFGARVTGKLGPYAVGAMFIDDQSPGRRVLPGDPLHGARARFGIFRVSRDIGSHSSIGAIYTSRELQGAYNRVGGADFRWRLGSNWTVEGQAVTSATKFTDGSTLDGPAYAARVRRSGRQLRLDARYDDFSEGFVTQTGFVNRVGLRRMTQEAEYLFRPEGKVLISWGPWWEFTGTWDRGGTRLDYVSKPGIGFDLIGQTRLAVYVEPERTRLRPQDFPGLPANRDFSAAPVGVYGATSLVPNVTVSSEVRWGSGVNFEPPMGQEPFLADQLSGSFSLALRPLRPLRIRNSYLFFRQTDRQGGANIFNNHVFRTAWNWQFTQALSVRLILQYDSLIANPLRTRLETSKNFNGDFLVTYQVNPWTALYVGYNSNLQNIDLLADPLAGTTTVVRTPRSFINDGRQLFVKFSYLLRY